MELQSSPFPRNSSRIGNYETLCPLVEVLFQNAKVAIFALVIEMIGKIAAFRLRVSNCGIDHTVCMGRPRITIGAVALSAITGVSAAAVSMMAYIRFQRPQDFADASIRMTHPELSNDFNRKWGLFGTGLIDSVPQSLKNMFDAPDMAVRYEQHKKKREQQIRQTLEDLRPKDK